MENYRNFSRFVNLFINSRNATALEQRNENYFLRRLDAPYGRIRIQPTYGITFYGVDMIVDESKKHGFSFYIDVELNHLDLFSPVLCFYPSVTSL